MTIAITREEVDTTLDSLVEKFGEGYVYPDWYEDKCLYVKGGSPSCLVGHALNRLGVPLDTLQVLDAGRFYADEDGPATVINGLQEFNEIGYYEDNDRYVDFEEAAAVKMDPYTRRVLAASQYLQDEGVRWGEAVRRARIWAASDDDSLSGLYKIA